MPGHRRDKRGYSIVALEQPKTPENIGAVLRAACCYDVEIVFNTGRRFRKSKTDVFKGTRHIPFIQTEDLHACIPFDCVPVAVEMVEGARPLPKYTHPERAFYIFGPEDGSLGKRITSWCRDIIYIPTNGCMNLAATVNVVLYDRMAKGRVATAVERRWSTEAFLDSISFEENDKLTKEEFDKHITPIEENVKLTNEEINDVRRLYYYEKCPNGSSYTLDKLARHFKVSETTIANALRKEKK
jgi:tRNA(Leu) C34 or U34 (ribose-2'-O)-methylase TrmL